MVAAELKDDEGIVDATHLYICRRVSLDQRFCYFCSHAETCGASTPSRAAFGSSRHIRRRERVLLWAFGRRWSLCFRVSVDCGSASTRALPFACRSWPWL